MLLLLLLSLTNFTRARQTIWIILIEGKRLKTLLFGCCFNGIRQAQLLDSSTRHDDATRGHGTTQHDNTRHGTTRMRLATGNGQRATGDRQLGRKTGPGRQHKISPSTHSHTDTHTQHTPARWYVEEGVGGRRVARTHTARARNNERNSTLFSRAAGGEFFYDTATPLVDWLSHLLACSLTCSLSLVLTLSLSQSQLFVLFPSSFCVVVGFSPSVSASACGSPAVSAPRSLFHHRRWPSMRFSYWMKIHFSHCLCLTAHAFYSSCSSRPSL